VRIHLHIHIRLLLAGLSALLPAACAGSPPPFPPPAPLEPVPADVPVLTITDEATAVRLRRELRPQIFLFGQPDDPDAVNAIPRRLGRSAVRFDTDGVPRLPLTAAQRDTISADGFGGFARLGFAGLNGGEPWRVVDCAIDLTDQGIALTPSRDAPDRRYRLVRLPVPESAGPGFAESAARGRVTVSIVYGLGAGIVTPWSADAPALWLFAAPGLYTVDITQDAPTRGGEPRRLRRMRVRVGAAPVQLDPVLDEPLVPPAASPTSRAGSTHRSQPLVAVQYRHLDRPLLEPM
jgi:hypothetical protein